MSICWECRGLRFVEHEIRLRQSGAVVMQQLRCERCKGSGALPDMKPVAPVAPVAVEAPRLSLVETKVWTHGKRGKGPCAICGAPNSPWKYKGKYFRCEGCRGKQRPDSNSGRIPKIGKCLTCPDLHARWNFRKKTYECYACALRRKEAKAKKRQARISREEAARVERLERHRLRAEAARKVLAGEMRPSAKTFVEALDEHEKKVRRVPYVRPAWATKRG